jgi:hypothetical protein
MYNTPQRPLVSLIHCDRYVGVDVLDDIEQLDEGYGTAGQPH